MSKKSHDPHKRPPEPPEPPNDRRAAPGSEADLRSFFPSRAAEIGRMYKLVADPQEDELIRRHAREAIDEFRELVRSFPLGSREHAYMVNFHDSALDYAASIRRLDRELEEELRMARRDRDADERGVLASVKHGALIKVAFHYLLIGGLFFFLAKSITSPVNPEAATLDRHAREVAAGIGSIVLAFIAQGLLLSHRLGRVRRRYDRRVWHARRDWAHAHVEVHNLALATVEHEWVEVTGQPAPLAQLARLQIRAVYLGALSARPTREPELRTRLAARLREVTGWRPRAAAGEGASREPAAEGDSTPGRGVGAGPVPMPLTGSEGSTAR
ncbi:MAG: hypothetical protein AB7O52_17555 [Planctomycetota bacterium]